MSCLVQLEFYLSQLLYSSDTKDYDTMGLLLLQQPRSLNWQILELVVLGLHVYKSLRSSMEP